MTESTTPDFLPLIWNALGGEDERLRHVEASGEGALRSIFAVTDLATASVSAAALAVSEFVGAHTGHTSAVLADRRLASFWFSTSFRPEGWSAPPTWDAIAGDYVTNDGWIRLHTNAPHHRGAALAVLNVEGTKDTVAAAVGDWQADALETAIMERGGCAAAMRSLAAWAEHPQGRSVAAEPLVWFEETGRAAAPGRAIDPTRPLAGVRVLDLTRILAGPVATRFLAGFGADVLRIDPPTWNEPSLEPEVTLGKRCVHLDIRTISGRDHLLGLLAKADVIVHGYRPDALERLGLGADVRQEIRPGLIDVSLDAYGWTGPWATRRGFDSLVQMSTGIAHEGMRRLGTDRPTPLPVQALDHATGYLMAAAAVRGLTGRLATGTGFRARVSLARMAALLAGAIPTKDPGALAPLSAGDFNAQIEATAWGPARRLRPPIRVDGAPMAWDLPATKLGSSPPDWLS